MRTNARISLTAGLVSVFVMVCANADSGRELLFSAPIQQIDRTGGTVTVLDQTFTASTDQLSAGQIVNVYGVLKKDGSVTDSVVQGTTSYGANGDPVFLKGVVTNTDAVLGRAEVDGLTVDYTAALADPNFIAPKVGDVISVAGTEPAEKGVLMATATGNRAYVAGVNEGGTSIAGVNVSGLSGEGSGGAGADIAGMSGGGTNRAGMSGGGTNRAGMSGGGTNRAGMSGGGTNRAGMSGGGTNRAGMSGGGTNRS